MKPPVDRASVIACRQLAIGHGRRIVAAGISFGLGAGEVVCLLGPNGSGKTTLLRTLLGLLSPQKGEVLLQGRPLAQWRRDEVARRIGYVPQAHEGLFPYRVQDVVLMGRSARIGRFATPSARDCEVADRCLDALGITHLRDCIYTRISGGERQLVLIARALAQEPVLLVMDEPTASLDFGNQIRVLEHVERLRNRGIAVLLSTHQPGHALRVADRIALLADGGISAFGPAHATATAKALAALYGVSTHLIQTHLPADPGPRETV